jgi:hypothetical protein
MASYNFDNTLLSGGIQDPSSIDTGGSLLGAAGDTASVALPWASFALKGAGAVAGGVGAYLQYKEQERQRAFQEKLLLQQLKDREKEYADAATQRSANTSLTLGQATGQNQTLREKLMMLSGTVRA